MHQTWVIINRPENYCQSVRAALWCVWAGSSFPGASAQTLTPNVCTSLAWHGGVCIPHILVSLFIIRGSGNVSSWFLYANGLHAHKKDNVSSKLFAGQLRRNIPLTFPLRTLLDCSSTFVKGFSVAVLMHVPLISKYFRKIKSSCGFTSDHKCGHFLIPSFASFWCVCLQFSELTVCHKQNEAVCSKFS